MSLVVRKSHLKNLGIVLAVAIGSIVLIYGVNKRIEDAPPDKRESISKHEAKVVAEGQVKTILKTPATAKFSGLGETEISPIGGGYRVVGYVDSQNSFGANIRTTYSIEITVAPTGKIMFKNLIYE